MNVCTHRRKEDKEPSAGLDCAGGRGNTRKETCTGQRIYSGRVQHWNSHILPGKTECYDPIYVVCITYPEGKLLILKKKKKILILVIAEKTSPTCSELTQFTVISLCLVTVWAILKTWPHQSPYCIPWSRCKNSSDISLHFCLFLRRSLLIQEDAALHNAISVSLGITLSTEVSTSTQSSSTNSSFKV